MTTQEIANEWTPAQRNRWLGSSVFTEQLAEYLMLTGIKIGKGDLNIALRALGVVLCSNDNSAIQLPSDYNQLRAWFQETEPIIETTLESLQEERRCPKCGLPQYHLRNSDYGWWHVRDNEDFGYQRRCWSPKMIALLPEDELAARKQFLASK
jgi:hypothetical protein